eukprot:TRINITY_DN1849_c0_g1_i1.p1 TRINITY_DN1849_c0_g1~~TRINITY_DN1849_c0_g1_i1.p1  ORF type:complete len:378 (-),score=99.43 TRINITY_DN1849_c0_g1_i1:263-1396(-)
MASIVQELSVPETVEFENTGFSNNGSNLTCITCRLLFPTPKEQKAHFKDELHRFNLKRKVANLPPVTQQIYDLKVKGAVKSPETLETETKDFKCETCNKHFASNNTYSQHMKSKKHLDLEKLGPQKKSEPKKASKVETENTTTPAPAPTLSSLVQDTSSFTQEELEFIESKLKTTKPLTIEDCLFCPLKSESFEANMDHMTKEHSLFIPDIEYVKDLQGLIKYLGDKVAIGNICLYCNGKGRSFNSLEAVQSHMRALSHCKLLYENNEDEYEDYYDFSTDYSDQADVKSSIQVSEDGNSLIFGNGKVIGHRTLSLYYRQHFKLPESRESVLLNKLMSEYRMLGWYNNQINNSEVSPFRDSYWTQDFITLLQTTLQTA